MLSSPAKSPASSIGSLSAAIDSNQLLSLCHRTRETTDSLGDRIRLTKLRLTSLRYIRAGQPVGGGDPAARCSDDLIKLCNLSQKVVQLLDELQTKLGESSRNSIDYQIATQQLIYFTYEWFDRLAPELENTFELANELINIDDDDDLSTKRRPRSPPSGSGSGGGGGDARVRDALLRLRQSMSENERLISTIANNIENTRATIETIFDSLQSTKVHLEAGEANAFQAIEETKQSKRLGVFCWFLLLILICVILSYIISWIVRLIGG